MYVVFLVSLGLLLCIQAVPNHGEHVVVNTKVVKLTAPKLNWDKSQTSQINSVGLKRNGMSLRFMEEIR